MVSPTPKKKGHTKKNLNICTYMERMEIKQCEYNLHVKFINLPSKNKGTQKEFIMQSLYKYNYYYYYGGNSSFNPRIYKPIYLSQSVEVVLLAGISFNIFNSRIYIYEIQAGAKTKEGRDSKTLIFRLFEIMVTGIVIQILGVYMYNIAAAMLNVNLN